MPELWELTDLETPWSVYVVATLRVADHIAAGRERIEDLAEAVGADAGALERVMRRVVEKGLFEEPEPGRFVLNDFARKLLNEGERAGADLHGMGGRIAFSWSTLLRAVQTGRPAYHEIFGRPYWEDLDANPEVAEAFDAMMATGHRTPDPDVLLDAGAWSSVRTVVDIGGGTGSLLAEVLRAHPGARGTLVDLPRTVARSAPVFEAAGVADRAFVSGQSFFDPLPAGADLYLMKSVLADWPDAEALAILTRCREAMGADSRLVLVNGVNPADKANPELMMLILVGGKDRTLPEFESLARQAGLTVSASGRDRTGRFLVECRRA